MDLRNIDAELKKMDSLKSATMTLIETEKNLNKAMRESRDIRKKQVDALTAAAEAQDRLLEKENKMNEIMVKSHKGLVRNVAMLTKQKKRKTELLRQLRDMRALNKKNTNDYKDAHAELNSLSSAIRGTANSIQEFEKNLNKTADAIKNVKGSAKGMQDTYSALSKIDTTQVSSYGQLKNLAQDRVDVMKKQIILMRKTGELSQDEAKRAWDQLDAAEAKYKMIHEGAKGKVSEESKGMLGEITQRAYTDRGKKGAGADFKQASFGKKAEIRGAQLSTIRGMLSGGASIGDRLKGAQSLKGSSGEIKKLNEVIGATGGKAKGLASMFNTLGAAMNSLGKLGWVGLLISAVGAIAKTINTLDKFLKQYNQTFAKLQGPTVMMENISGEMNKFSDSIFNLQRNLKYGLKAEDISGMFQGVAESGMSLQGILKNVTGGYDAMIEESAKLSLNFGVSIQESGSMIGEQMTDLRSSIDEVSDSFKVLSYDASIAGIQSQKFYQATYAAAESLSYYGKFVEAASGALKKFQTQGGMGFKDAQKATQDLIGSFQNMDDNTRTMFINLTGGTKAYGEIAGKELASVNKQIANNTAALALRKEALVDAIKSGDTKKVEELKNRIAAEETALQSLNKSATQWKGAFDAAMRGSSQDLATYLPLFADDTAKLMGDRLGEALRSGLKIFEGDERAIYESLSKTGMSRDLAEKYVQSARMIKEEIDSLNVSMKDQIEGIETGKRSALSDILKTYAESGEVDMNKLRSEIAPLLEGTSIDMAKFMDDFQKMPSAVSKLISEGYDVARLQSEAMALKDLQSLKVITGEGDKEQAKRLEDLVLNTRTIEDMVGIGKENAMYFAADMDITKLAAKATIGTAMNVGKIAGWVERIATGKKGGRTEDEFRKSKDYEELGALVEKGVLIQSELQNTKDDKRKKELEDKLKEVEEKKKKVGGDNQYLEGDFAASAMQKVTKLYEDKVKAEKSIAVLQEKGKSQTGEELRKTEKSIAYLQDAINTRSGGIVNVGATPVDKQQDYKAATGGYALLSKGDVVVNAKSMSSGIGGDIGSFAGEAASNYIKSSRSYDTKSAPTIPVSISIGSVSGDPEEFIKRIKPAIEQAFERMYFEKQKRK